MISRDNDSGSKARGLGRRDLLRMGGLGLGYLGVGAPAFGRRAAFDTRADRSVILLLLVGGPSQLETWDPKPDAPAEIRGPFASIQTSCPGVRVNEHLPRLAARMHRLAIVRSLFHDEAPIHETGLQLLQTGRLCRCGEIAPHFGSLIASQRGSQNGLPPFVVLQGLIHATGVDIPHGQTAAWLEANCAPFALGADPGAPGYDANLAWRCARASVRGSSPSRSLENPFDLEPEADSLREQYGRTSFGQSCLLARRLVESGVHVVTINMFDTVFDTVTWDCHGASPFGALGDYARVLLPEFDRAFSALIDDLDRRGRLDSTLVVAAGEFGAPLC